MWLVVKREYLERVRKKSFLIMTVIVPVLMALVIWVPFKFASRGSLEQRVIMIAAPTQHLADSVSHQLVETLGRDNDDLFSDDTDRRSPKLDNDEVSRYTIETRTDLSEQSKDDLRNQVNTGGLSGFLWIDVQSLKDHKVKYYSKESTNFSEQVSLQSALRQALTRQELSAHGLTEQDIESVLTPVSVRAARVQKGKDNGSSGFGLYLAAIMMVTLLYITVFVYGIAVMRSVIEEKSSRIMEVMLSCVTPRDLMGGKIIGVGGVGLTQIAIWILISIAFSSPAMIALKSMAGGIHIPIATIAYFAIFFLLGYLLYSSVYAAIGAMVNSEQEAQQIQFVVLMPLIFAMVIAQTVIQHPSSELAISLSMVPFFAPMLMFVRIIIETPPWWQIAICIALMVLTIYALLLLCARIYRVGILMYGKRPTLPELLKWLRYAG